MSKPGTAFAPPGLLGTWRLYQSAEYSGCNMAFNTACLGRTYGADWQELDRQRHLAYLLAVTGEQQRFDAERPLACFAAVYLLWPIVPLLFSDPNVGLDLTRLLHGEQEFWFDRPMEFGERVKPTGIISRAEERRGMVFLELTCHGEDGAGHTIAHSRSLFLVRGAP
ncbi:MAG TPA: MaoC family dehydratase N-terminal domain-containing protein [Candidatus Dormibacteraeota bacterium]|nr:MaoC family dehydratase N-terminal domain-containing protein [Candidatus Dormibacteraeota bacterium]